MKIIRAQKLIARLKGEVKILKHRIEKSLNTIAANEDFDEDYFTLQRQLDEKIKKIVSLKTKVMHANVKHDMFQKIVNVGELKSYIDYLRELEPKTGVISSEYNPSEKTEYKSQMTIAQRNESVEITQRGINKLTDELDDFNAKTDIEEMDVTVLLVD